MSTDYLSCLKSNNFIRLCEDCSKQLSLAYDVHLTSTSFHIFKRNVLLYIYFNVFYILLYRNDYILVRSRLYSFSTISSYSMFFSIFFSCFSHTSPTFLTVLVVFTLKVVSFYIAFLSLIALCFFSHVISDILIILYFLDFLKFSFELILKLLCFIN